MVGGHFQADVESFLVIGGEVQPLTFQREYPRFMGYAGDRFDG